MLNSDEARRRRFFFGKWSVKYFKSPPQAKIFSFKEPDIENNNQIEGSPRIICFKTQVPPKGEGPPRYIKFSQPPEDIPNILAVAPLK